MLFGKFKKKHILSQDDALLEPVMLDTDGLFSSEAETESDVKPEAEISAKLTSEADAEAESGASVEARVPSEDEAHSKSEGESEDVLSPSQNDFEKSLENFSKEDIDVSVDAKKGGRDFARLLITGICITAFVISTGTLIGNIRDKIRSEQIYGDIIDNFGGAFNTGVGLTSTGGKVTLLAGDAKAPFTPTMDQIVKNGVDDLTTPSDNSAQLAKIRASLESLRNINPDIYGWISIPGTNINYPIAQTDNNEYYLDHAYNGDNLVNGSIYADYRCNALITHNYNTVLYGHNITSGAMFLDVVKFFKEETFNSTTVYLYTFDGIFAFKPFSVHEAAYDSGFVDMWFPDGKAFTEFATKLASESEIKSDYIFSENDRILTLSTCTNGVMSKRYALHCVLVEVISN